MFLLFTVFHFLFVFFLFLKCTFYFIEFQFYFYLLCTSHPFLYQAVYAVVRHERPQSHASERVLEELALTACGRKELIGRDSSLKWESECMTVCTG